MDCILPGSFVLGILQARILESVAISFRESSWFRDQTQVSFIADRFFTNWATRENCGKVSSKQLDDLLFLDHLALIIEVAWKWNWKISLQCNFSEDETHFWGTQCVILYVCMT